MSGALGFIRSNPAMAGYDAMDQRLARTRQRDQAQATDAAIRAGIADMSSPQVPAAPPPEPLRAAPAPSAPAPPATPAPAPALANVRAGGNAPPAPASMYRDPEALARRDAMLDAPPEALAAESARRATAVGQPLHNPATVRPDAPVAGWDAGLPAPSGVINASVGGGTPVAAPAAQQAPQAAPQGQNPRNPYGPILSRLANTPGGGATALGLLQRGETDNRLRDVATSRATGQATAAATRARQAAERNIQIAIGRGDRNYALYLGQQHGIEIPEWALDGNSAEARQAQQRFATASLVAERQYGADPDQARRFMETYLQTGDARTALNAAGRPTGAPVNWRPEWVLRDEQEVLLLINPRTGETRYAQQPGAAPSLFPAAPPAATGQAPAPVAPAAPAGGGAPVSLPPTGNGHPGGPITRPARGGSALQQRIDEMVRNGVPRELASGAATGQHVVRQDPVDGTITIIDRTSGRVLHGPNAGGQVGQVAPSPGAPGDPAAGGAQAQGGSLPTEGADFRGATGAPGLVAETANFVADLFGGSSLPAPQTAAGAQALRNLDTRTRMFLQSAIPGRPSNYLMEMIGGLTISPATVSLGPERARERVAQTTRFLEQTVREMEEIARSQGTGRFTRQDIGEANRVLVSLRPLLVDYQTLEGAFQQQSAGGARQPRRGSLGGRQSPAPAGVDQRLWEVMTPGERALWQN